ncbi:MAG: hypothetical protein WCK98_01480 [bacterium]
MEFNNLPQNLADQVFEKEQLWSEVLQAIPEMINLRGIFDKLHARIKAGESVNILFTDIDHTLSLHGKGYSSEETTLSNAATLEVLELLDDNQVVVIPVTGSSWSGTNGSSKNISQRIGDGDLPAVFDVLVTSGGNVATFRNEQGYATEYPYNQYIAELNESFDKTHMLSAAIGLTAEINDSQCNFPFEYVRKTSVELNFPYPKSDKIIYPQDNNAVRDYSYHMYFFAQDAENANHIQRLVNEKLGANYKVVICEEKDHNSSYAKAKSKEWPKKFCLDVALTDKSTPLEYYHGLVTKASNVISERLGKSSKCEIKTFYAGDAGNDWPAFRSSVVDSAVIVGNAAPELTARKEDLICLGKEVHIAAETKKGPHALLAYFKNYFKE